MRDRDYGAALYTRAHHWQQLIAGRLAIAPDGPDHTDHHNQPYSTRRRIFYCGTISARSDRTLNGDEGQS